MSKDMFELNSRIPSARRCYSSQKCSRDHQNPKKIFQTQKDVGTIMPKIKKNEHRQSCASANSSSSSRPSNSQRRRSLDSIHAGVHMPGISLDIFHPPKTPHLPSVFEDQKIFLHGSQMLERLNKILKYNSDGTTDLSKTFTKYPESDEEFHNYRLSKQNLKRVTVLHDRLKNLLAQRCLLVLKEECIDHIQSAEKFIEEAKSLALREKIKIKNMPVKTRNRFIDSTDINICTLTNLMENLSIHADLWLSLMRNFQRIISIFHIGFDLQLHQLLCKTNIILKRLRHRAFYWVYYNLDINIQKLCQSDPNSVSSEFLQNVLEACKTFNSLLVEKKQVDGNHLYCEKSFIFRNFGGCEITDLSCSYILNYLSHFEAGIAAERIVRFLASEGLREIKCTSKNDLIIKWVPDTIQQLQNQKDNNTSDYYSASASETDNIAACEGICSTWKIKVQPVEGTPNLASVMGILLQRNQALVLKYIFAVTCLNSTPSDDVVVKTRPEANKKHNLIVRQMWQLPGQRYSDKSCTFLEKVYWSHFWYQTQKVILQLLLEVSYQQYGDMLAGTITLWPDDLSCAVMNILKQSSSDEDMCPEAQNIVQHVYYHLYCCVAQTVWDKRLCSALAVTQSPRCPAVPVVEGRAGTNPGNLLCTALEPLIGSFITTIPVGQFKYSLKAMQQLQCSLNYLYSWADVRKRALLSSWNISSYLLVSCSDIQHASKLLAYLKLLKWPKTSLGKKPTYSSNTTAYMWRCLLEQIVSLENTVLDISPLVYQKAYSLASEMMESYLPSTYLWRMLKKDTEDETNSFIQEAIRILLIPVSDTLRCIPNQSSVILAVGTSVAQAWLDCLWNRKAKFSVRSAQQFHKDVWQLIKWIDQSSLSIDDKKKFKIAKSIRKLVSVAELLSSSDTQSRWFNSATNRVVPLPSVEPECASTNDVLSANERDRWKTLHINDSLLLSTCSCCF